MKKRMKFSTITFHFWVTFQFFQILYWWMRFNISKVPASLLLRSMIMLMLLWTQMTKGYEWWDLSVTQVHKNPSSLWEHAVGLLTWEIKLTLQGGSTDNWNYCFLLCWFPVDQQPNMWLLDDFASFLWHRFVLSISWLVDLVHWNRKGILQMAKDLSFSHASLTALVSRNKGFWAVKQRGVRFKRAAGQIVSPYV